MAKQVHFNTPSIKGWHCYLAVTLLNRYRAGVNVAVEPFAGEEDSEISAWFYLPWFEVAVGIENNPYDYW